MKLSFSTRGWAHLSWEEWIEAGVNMRFEGIEVYNLPKFPELMERSGPFHKYNTAATVRRLRDSELTIPLFLHLRSDFFDRDKTPFVALNAGVQWSTGWGDHAGLILEPAFGYSINTGVNNRLNFSFGLALDMYDMEIMDLGTNFKIGLSF